MIQWPIWNFKWYFCTLAKNKLLTSFLCKLLLLGLQFSPQILRYRIYKDGICLDYLIVW
uniref:Uncharacterized protein n=1 Tax=Arundo donax TaxID=35708 RepID=A0A0A9AF13_ARUDO